MTWELPWCRRAFQQVVKDRCRSVQHSRHRTLLPLLASWDCWSWLGVHSACPARQVTHAWGASWQLCLWLLLDSRQSRQGKSFKRAQGTLHERSKLALVPGCKSRAVERASQEGFNLICQTHVFKKSECPHADSESELCRGATFHTSVFRVRETWFHHIMLVCRGCF